MLGHHHPDREVERWCYNHPQYTPLHSSIRMEKVGSSIVTFESFLDLESGMSGHYSWEGRNLQLPPAHPFTLKKGVDCHYSAVSGEVKLLCYHR